MLVCPASSRFAGEEVARLVQNGVTGCLQFRDLGAVLGCGYEGQDSGLLTGDSRDRADTMVTIGAVITSTRMAQVIGS